MKELDVYRALLARAENYAITNVQHVQGRLYSLEMKQEHYNAVVLLHSFDYYRLRYHIQVNKPTLIVCYVHDTVVPIPVLSMEHGNYAKAYDWPEDITAEDIERPPLNKKGARVFTQTGARVLLGAYISGVRVGQTIMKNLPHSTRTRYLQKVEDLGRRKPGRPVK